MARPIAPNNGIAFAFPDVCLTPAPPSAPIPVPYPNIARLSDATAISDEGGKELKIGSYYALLLDSEVATSTGDEAGSNGGVTSGTIQGKCVVTQASGSVLYGPNSKGLARFLDTTSQNQDNAQGIILGAFPTVLVGD